MADRQETPAQPALGRTARYCAVLAISLCLGIAAGAQKSSLGKVTIQEDASAYTLSNGIISIRVDKSSGDLLSVKFKNTEMLATIMGPDGLPDVTVDKPGQNLRGGFHSFTDHQYGFWSHDASGPETTSRITIDPKANGGERGEIAVKGISGGRPMGAGPGGSFIADIEIRYTLQRGDSAVYTYMEMTHQPQYPASVLGEARFCVKLAGFFDWMSVGPKWNKPYPKAAPGEHEDKYDFTADQFDNRAYGWSSTTKHVGFWFINPSVEYLSGGPTKVEFLGHRDTNSVQAPTVLNYWRSSHYGGAVVDVSQGEHWSKVVGPFLLYINQGDSPQAMYEDALARARAEEQKWPYDWVNGVDYPHRAERAAVTGRIVLKDPQAKSARLADLLVGLTYPAYMIRPTARDGAGSAAASTSAPSVSVPLQQIDWQRDAKHYEFWTRADANGNFRLTAVRPGTYTLYAFADGVLGELAKTGITVSAGKPLDLGTIDWTPKRYGRQIWEVGIPNRSGEEFAGGNDYSHDGEFLVYAKLFPNDVNYVVGKSDYRKDWFFEQVPHNEDPAAKPAAYNMHAGTGRATPWTITFNLPTAPVGGKAHLRLALASTSAPRIDVAVNGQALPPVDHLFRSGAIGRNGIHGVWSEHDVAFDASLLKAGTNTITLTVPAGPLTAGVIYDYLRLELE